MVDGLIADEEDRGRQNGRGRQVSDEVSPALPPSQQGGDINRRLDMAREQLQREQQSTFRQSFNSALERNPEQEAEAERLAASTGIPKAAVAADIGRANRDKRLKDIQSAISSSPVLAAQLRDQDFASVAHDDIEQLSQLERLLTPKEPETPEIEETGLWTGTVQNFQRGREDVRLAELNFQAISSGLNAEQLEERDRLSESMAAQTPIQNDNPIGSVLFDTARQLPIYGSIGLQAGERGSQAGLIAGGATLLTGAGAPAAPITATGAFGAGAITGTIEQSFILETGLAYEEYRNFLDESGAPIDDNVARGAAILAGSINAGFETTGASFLARGIPGLDRLTSVGGKEAVRRLLKRPTFRDALKQFGQRYAGNITVETATESIQELVNTLVGEAAKEFSGQEFGDPVTAGEALGRSAEAGATAFRATLLIGLPGPASSLYQDTRRARQAQQNADAIQSLNETAEGSKTRERLPERMREFVDEVTEDGPVDTIYVDVERWDELFQSENVDPEQAAAEVFNDDGQSYRDAKAEGGDLPIPTGRYAEKLAGTEYGSRLAPDMRFQVDAMSAREAQAWQAEMDQMVEDVQEGVTGDVDVFNEIRDDISGQLINAGVPQDSAENQARVTAAFVVTQAKYENIDPRELYQSRTQRISRPLPEVLQTRGGNVDINLDPLIDRVRAGDIPSEQQVFGNSLLDFLREYGLVPDSELEARDVDRKLAPFQRRLVRDDGQLTLDDAALYAWESGYIQSREGTQDRPPLDDLLSAIDQELMGEPVYQSGALDTPEVSERSLLLELDQFFAEQGIDLNEISNEEARGLLEQAAGQEGDVELGQPIEGQPRLLAVHNITEDNLLSASDLGGLAAPSIGVITEEAGGVRGFGDITLIGREGLADPEQSPVFSADAYTARFPRPEWGAANPQEAERLSEEAGLVQREFDDYLAEPTLDLMLENPNANELVNVWLRSIAGKALFLRERGIDVQPVMQASPMSSRVPAEVVQQLAPLIEAIDQTQSFEQIQASPEFARLASEFEALLTEYYQALEVRPELLENLVGDLTFGRFDRLLQDINVLDTEVVNKSETRASVNSLVEPLEAEYKKWVEDKIVPAFGDPFLTVNGRRAPYTLPNIVEQMTSREVRGAEETITYGAGQVRASSTIQFSDIEQMREAAQTAIADPEEYNSAKAEVDQTLENYRDMMREQEFEVDDTWEQLDASMRALAKYATSQTKTAEAMRNALESEGFTNAQSMSEQDIGFAIEAANDLLDAPVPYFESKPGRAVELNEFAAAVVPEGISEQTAALLEEQGITVRTYERGNDQAREATVLDLAREVEQTGEQVFFQEEAQEGRRGSIRFQREGERKVFSITLFDKANLSTYLHESGHYFLEVMGDLVEREGASPRLRDDWQRILSFLEVESRDQIGTPQHEKWARAFEAYLREGKAPSQELQTAFSKFRAWLVAIYRQLRQLDIEITDEVRGVMDRMLATDEQIRAATEQQNYQPIFESAEQANMSAEEFAAYERAVQSARAEAENEVMQRMNRETQREARVWWKEERAKKREEVEREVFEQPAYRALFFLQKGRMPLDEQGPAGFKLDRAALVDRYGKEFLKRLPGPKSQQNRGAYIYAREGGQNPETAANMLGFSSADQMIKSMIELRDTNQLIEAETDARMRADYGDLMTDGSLPEAAMEAVHNEGRSELLSSELKILNRRRGGQDRSFIMQIKASAARHINNKRIMDIRPDRYRRAEAKASRLAFEAASAQDFNEAFVQKQKQLYNHHLYRAAKNAREQAEKDRRRILKFQNRRQREILGKAGESYLDQVDQILEDHQFTQVSGRAVERRIALREWLAEQNVEFSPLQEPDYVSKDPAAQSARKESERADPRNPDLEALAKDSAMVAWKEMTPEELSGVRDNLDLIYHLAKLKTQLVEEGDKRTLDAAAEEVISSIIENANRKIVADLQPERAVSKSKRARDEFFTKSRRIPSFAREMDGGEDAGAVWRNVIQPLNRASSNYNDRVQQHGQRLEELLDKFYKKSDQRKFLRNPQYYESIDASLTKDAVLAIALNWGNETNRARLLAGEGWTNSQVQGVLDTLEKRDWDFVQETWDYLEEYWPEFKENHRALYGIPPTKVASAPVQTAFGEYKGGYYPIKFDATRSTRANADQFREEGRRFQDPASRQRAGASQSRVRGEVRMPIRLSVASVVNQHVTEVIRHIAYDRPLLDVARLLTRDDVKQAMVSNYGQEVYNRFYRALVDIRWGVEPAHGVFEGFLDHTRNGASVAYMGFKATTALLQPLGLSNSLVVLGGNRGAGHGSYWMMRGLMRVGSKYTQMESAGRFAMRQSSFMRSRRENVNREVSNVLSQVKGGSTRQKIAATAFYPITMMQFVIVDMPTWYAGYEKAISAGLDEKTAIESADQTVREAQGGGDLIDQTEFQRGNAYTRAFTNFMSYMSTTYSIQAERYRSYNLRSFSDLVRLVTDHMLLAVFPAVGNLLIQSMRDSEEDDEEGLGTAIAYEYMSMITGPFIGVREFASAVEGFSYRGPAGQSGISEPYKLTQQLTQVAFAEDLDESIEQLDESLARSAIRTGGVLFHLPAAQLDASFFGTKALIDGETDNPASILFGPPRK